MIYGLWSPYIFYYDAFEDIKLCFDKGNKGFIAYQRPGYDEIDYFTWKVNEDGLLELLGYRNVIALDDIVKEDTKSDLFLTGISYEKSLDKTVSEEEVEVINFSQDLLGEKRFGLISKDFETEPEFKRINSFLKV